VEDDYCIACDRPKREIRRLARYVDSEGLVAYTFIVAEEIPKSVEPSTYTEAISCPSSPNWILVCKKKWRAYTRIKLRIYVNYLKAEEP